MIPYLIGIAGPSGAGKSVLCRTIQSSFENVSRLKLDDFFKDIHEVPLKGSWQDWDEPSSLHWGDLVQAAQDLKSGKYAIVPHYSRKEDRRVGEKCVFPAPIILVDGFMTLVHKPLRDLLDLKLFYTLSEHSQVSRRRERQPWVEEGYLKHVMLPSARKYILPSGNHADYIINAELTECAVAQQTMEILYATIPERLKKLPTVGNFRTHSLPSPQSILSHSYETKLRSESGSSAT